MSLFSTKTVIALTCATALSALTAAPSFAGVITPTDKTTVSTASPIDSVYYRYGWCHHRHYWRPWHTVWVYPSYYPYTYAGWGGWGWGGGLGGLFPFL